MLFLVLQQFPSLKLKPAPHRLTPNTPLSLANLLAKLSIGLRMAFNLGVLMCPLYLSFAEFIPLAQVVTYFVGMSALIALFIDPPFELSKSPTLALTKPLVGRSVDLHLKSAYQPFTRQTYKELLQFVKILPDCGINQINLSSPMFYAATGEVRDMDLLSQLVAHHGATLQHGPSPTFKHLMGVLTLLTSKDEAHGRENIKLNLWYSIHIKLRDNRQ